MYLNTVATNRFFHGLTCPYTGKKITVRVVANGRRKPMYFSPDAFDPSMVHDSADALLRTAGSRNGVAGVIQGDKLVCPYTGAKLTLVRRSDGFALDGGFSPSSLHADAAEFGRMLWTRDGKFTGQEIMFSKVNVVVVDREPVETDPNPQSGEPSDEAMEAVGELAHNLVKPVTVTVPGSVPRKKKKG